ncbi:tripeptidyl-peptidase sed4 [Melanomma pulvis-pyrius CBS 109.77]|uniref:tripeptidyl-peptidase II n=1 Tax=Melanomma pulvis-pyrius CBS 109.77 TaxID=1314802 RepID=A0A6A6WWB6_9PLEO|nr:tripeptidyl-peptidase sed4 [Melanomma pulvis-pyrius CBS 109.77]
MAPLLQTALWAFLFAGTTRAAKQATTQAYTARNWALHETASVPPGWKTLGLAADTTPTSASIHLQQPRMGDLRRRLSQISDPQNADFGAHLSREQLYLYQEPSAAAVDAVSNWLGANGIEDRRVENSWIHFNATVGLLNALLRCNLAAFETPRKRRVLRTVEYSLPGELVEHVQFVHPVTQFTERWQEKKKKSYQRHDKLSTRVVPASCLQNVDPTCLVDLYNITHIPADALSGSTLGVAGFLEEYPNQANVRTFLTSYSPRRADPSYTPDYNFSVTSINNGSTTNTGSGGEALLDLDYTMAFTQPLPVVYFSTGGRGSYVGPNGTDESNTTANGNEPWLEFLTHLLELPDVDLPKVLSVSYTDDEQSVARPYALYVCDLFMQLGARGVSVLVASGDGGAAGTSSSTNCVVNSGNSQDPPRYIPTFPASCPYVTAVGATGRYFPMEPAYFSSGGFSEYFAVPEWQAAATGGYVVGLNGSHDGWYNPAGRGIPDVAAIGVRFVLGGEGGNVVTAKGTSASTPVWAAVVALLNDRRLREGKPVLGFLNPVLYSEAVRGALEDVRSGVSGGCTWNGGNDFVEGWSAVEGWDPSTGLGTPDFGALMEVLG